MSNPCKQRPRLHKWRTKEGFRVRELLNDGGSVSYRIELPASVTGRRILKQFKTREDVDVYSAAMAVQRKNSGLAAFSLTDSQRQDANGAFELLAPAGVGLLDAVKYFLKHARPPSGDITVTELIERYLDTKEKKQLRPRSLADLKSRMNIFGKLFGSRFVKDIRADEVEGWLFADPSHSNQTRRNYRTVLSGFFEFARLKKYLIENPIGAVTNPIVDDAEPRILSVTQASALLNTAWARLELGVLPYLALALYCGIRAAELARLEWSALDMTANHIEIGPKIAKKRRIRVVDLPDCCRAWLLAGGVRPDGPIRPAGFERRWNKLVAAADRFGGLGGDGTITESGAPLGLIPWPVNAMRHSAASYHFAFHGDASKTCAMLGQRNDEILFTYYRKLVRRPDAERFYRLYPPTQPANVVALPAAVA